MWYLLQEDAGKITDSTIFYTIIVCPSNALFGAVFPSFQTISYTATDIMLHLINYRKYQSVNNHQHDEHKHKNVAFGADFAAACTKYTEHV